MYYLTDYLESGKVEFLMRFLSFVAAALHQLDEGIGRAITSAWSKNTRATRNSQWKSYLTFCAEHKLKGLPATDLTVARFLLFKAKTVKYVTVNNYLSAVISLHRYYGFEAKFRESYFINMVLEGLKSMLGMQVSQKMSLSCDQLIMMHNHVKIGWSKERVMWYSLVTAFRTLLRKSNLIPEKIDEEDSHVVLRRDVEKTDFGFCVNVYSSKTLKHKKRILRVPLVECTGSPLCAVNAIRSCLSREKASSYSPIFVFGGRPILYSEVLEYLKKLVALIGLNPQEAGLHSMRRSGALFLQSLGVPLEEIMYMGDWASMSVLDYLITTYDRKVSIENMVSQCLSKK